MPNPRNTVDFESQAQDNLTFKADNITIIYDATKAGGSVSTNLAVTYASPATVKLAADGDAVVGKLLTVEPSGADAKCTVQVGGAMHLSGGTGSTLTGGAKIVGALLVAAPGYIRSAASAVPAELVKARGIILDPTDPTNVAVWLQ